MDRRSFLRLAGGVSAVAVVAPKLILPSPRNLVAERRFFLPPADGWPYFGAVRTAYSRVELSQELVDDGRFPLEAYLNREFANTRMAFLADLRNKTPRWRPRPFLLKTREVQSVADPVRGTVLFRQFYEVGYPPPTAS